MTAPDDITLPVQVDPPLRSREAGLLMAFCGWLAALERLEGDAAGWEMLVAQFLKENP